jgi:hypothetical protein
VVVLECDGQAKHDDEPINALYEAHPHAVQVSPLLPLQPALHEHESNEIEAIDEVLAPSGHDKHDDEPLTDLYDP